MTLLIAILCFFGALFFVVLAIKDKYVSGPMHKVYGDAFGHHHSIFWARFVIAALLTFAGVKLL